MMSAQRGRFPAYQTKVTPEAFMSSSVFLDQVRGNPIVDDVKKCMWARRPIHRHHLRELLRLLYSSPQIRRNRDPDLRSTLEGAAAMMQVGEWFNFGSLTNDLMSERIHDAVELMSHGIIRMPYPYCIYQHSLDFGSSQVHGAGEYMQDFYIVVDSSLIPTEVDPEAKRYKNVFGIIEFRLEEYHDVGIAFSIRLAASTDFKLNGAGAYSAGLKCNPLMLEDRNLVQEVNSMCDPVAVMNIMLNTKGIKVERVEPAAKLNAVRAKKGQPLLTPYTVVHTHQYIDAMREGMRMQREGHRNSPRPHLRRGHMRHYRSGKETWVFDMLVNSGKGDFVQRDGYKVNK